MPSVRTEWRYSALKKAILSHGTTRMDLEDMMLSERSQSRKDNSVCLRLEEAPRALRFLETERGGVARGGGEGKSGVDTWRQRVSALQDGRVLETGYKGCEYTEQCWTVYFEVVKMVNFMLHVSYHNV